MADTIVSLGRRSLRAWCFLAVFGTMMVTSSIAARAQTPPAAPAVPASPVPLPSTPGDPRLVFLAEEVGPNGITIAARGAKIKHDLTLRSLDHNALEVALSIDVVLDERATAIATSVNPRTVTLSPLGGTPVTIEAILEQPGTYTGTLQLVYGRARYGVPLRIIRRRPSISIEALHPIHRLTSAPISFDVSIHETGGVATKILPPTLEHAALEMGYAESQEDLQIEVSPGSDAQKQVSPGNDAQKQVSPGSDTQFIELKPGETRRLTLELRNADFPAEHLAELQVLTESGDSVRQPVLISVKRPWYWGVAAIMVGAGLGVAAGRLLGKRASRRLLVEIDDLAETFERMLETLKGETALSASLLCQIAALRRRARNGRSIKDLQKELDCLSNKVKDLRLMPKARTILAALGTHPMTATLAADVRSAESVLTDPNATLETSKGATTRITEVLDKGPKYIQAQRLKGLAEEMLAGLECLSSAHDGATAFTKAQKRLSNLISECGGSESRSLEWLSGQRSAAAAGYLNALVEALVAHVSNAAMPDGVTVETWQKLQFRVDELRGKAGQVQASATQEDLNVLSKSLAQTARELEELRQRARSAGSNVAALDNSIMTCREARRAPSLLESSNLVDGFSLGRAPADTPSKLEWSDSLVLQISISLLLGLASGMPLLWHNNPAWGSTLDIAIALLWGLGAGEIAVKSFSPKLIETKLASQ